MLQNLEGLIFSQIHGMHSNAPIGLSPFNFFLQPTVCAGLLWQRNHVETGQSEHGYVIIAAALATRLRFLQLRRHELHHHQLPPVRDFDKTFLSAIVLYAPILQTPVVLSRTLPDQSGPMQALQTTAIPNTFSPNNRTPNLHILNRHCSNL